MAEPIRLAVIIGSVRQGRFGPTVADWLTEQATHRAATSIDVIDLADEASRPRLAERIGAADAIVVITPEYNHAYPGPLKEAIDSLGAEWYAKAVAFVCYGGISGGLRAVEQLRLVFAELNAVTIRETVSFHNAGNCFDAAGRPLDTAAVNRAAATMFDQLDWWANTLRQGRLAQPIPA
ncbi:NADPH-dependent FMN reductase [Actinoalloteichus hymeniacidonis]|uniref:Flavoprotein n=1 Tax=Actinoalloteichus hymeniacidonis TaxID=340345 RepID=A0AAC9MYM7_9PSEU|nr:NAD(P)H-dependent oxidoreductase [Actinoalloteichus hymeniacidonis]AOS63629.1 putative flavoprotein [Actinoalloteichus hymeniacidonis]MBB5908323.1 NAD(P)H-dependent FMN reductase [Actinoalloteichus hymeniacidonis]